MELFIGDEKQGITPLAICFLLYKYGAPPIALILKERKHLPLPHITPFQSPMYNSPLLMGSPIQSGGLLCKFLKKNHIDANDVVH